MRKKTITIACSILIFLGACQSPETRQHPHHHAQVDTQTPLETNHGEKWKVNEEMKPFVSQGAQWVKAYIDEERTDYKRLADALKEQNELLIKNCTMDGKSHDELHKWLHPHLEMVEGLRNSRDEDEAMKRVHELHFSYQKYYDYFE